MKKISKLFLMIAAIFTWSNTAIAQNTDCLGVTKLATKGVFTDGYIYKFTTTGTDVTVTFELLDNKPGLAAYIFTYNPDFTEVSATNTSGKKFSKTFTGQTIGANFKVACKFAYAGGLVVTKIFTYVVGSSCSDTPADTELPTLFTVNKGAVTYHSVELLLNATDNSGTVLYEITNGTNKFVTTGISGVEKPYTISGLNAATPYNFSVVAKDVSDNAAANSPVSLDATTSTNTSTECAGSYTDAQQGEFTDGYNYTFATSGTDVTVTFELLDNKTGVNAFLWTYNPDFAEAATTLVSGKKFTKTFTGQALDSKFKVACKFAFSGGMAVTKTLTYTVGNSCGGSGGPDTVIPTLFSASKGSVNGNSVELLLNATDNSGAVIYTITYGTTTLTVNGTSGVQKSYIVAGLSPTTEYSFSVVVKDANGNEATNNPIVISATTTMNEDPNLLLSKNQVWSYNDSNTSLDETGWNASAYNFSSWKTGQSPFGYANAYTNIYADIKTNLTKGSGLKTAYFKTTFTIPEGTILSNYDIYIDHLVDDGVMLYLNNASELSSFFTDFSRAPFASLATTTVGSPAWVLNAGPYPTTNLVIGTNEISGIAKNITANSSDLVFGIVMRLVPKNIQAPTSFTATKGAVTSNSVELLLNATDDSGEVYYTISYGDVPTVVQINGTSGVQKSYIVSDLNPATEYNFSVVAKNALGNAAANSPIVVQATTTSAVTATTTIDYETVGNTWTWTVFGNGAAGVDDPAGLTVPFANPSASGINTSSNCLKFIDDAGALPWGGFFSENMAPFTISAANCYVKVMVHKDKLSRFGVKFEGATEKEILISNTLTNEWELMTFDFTSEIGKTFNKLVLLPDFNDPRTSGGTSYIDNISFSNGTTAVKNISADKTIQIYPTIFKSDFTVKSESEMSQVVVRNLVGQTLRTFNVSGKSQKIELSDFISGNYLITVSLINGNYSTKKIVKL